MSEQGTVKEEIGGIKDRVVGDVKDAYGSVTGNTAIEREGEIQNAQGNERQTQNRILTGMFNDRDSADRA